MTIRVLDCEEAYEILYPGTHRSSRLLTTPGVRSVAFLAPYGHLLEISQVPFWLLRVPGYPWVGSANLIVTKSGELILLERLSGKSGERANRYFIRTKYGSE